MKTTPRNVRGSVKVGCEALDIYPLDHITEEQRERTIRESEGLGVAAADDATSITDSPQGGEDQTTEADVSTAAYGPFSGYSEASGFPDPREAFPANVRDVLHQIIETDGPLTRMSACRLYVEGCTGLTRVGKVVRQALNRALGVMLRAGEIVQEDELSDGSPEGQVIRLADNANVRVRPAGRRDLLDIPPSELLAVLGRLFPTNPGTGEDDEALPRGLLEHYGFSRLTRPRRDYLSKVLRLWHSRAREIGATDGTRSVGAV